MLRFINLVFEKVLGILQKYWAENLKRGFIRKL